MIDPGHQINCFNRRVMAQAILRVLAETDMLAMKTQSVWWSLQGPTLARFDKTLEQQRQELLDAMTPLARWIRALGSDIVIDNSTMQAHARIVVLQLQDASVSEASRELPHDHLAVADAIRRARILAATLDDKATLALLDLRLLAHESASTQLETRFSGLDEEHEQPEMGSDNASDPAEVAPA